jgi:HD domain
MTSDRAPATIGSVLVPRNELTDETWRWAHRSLPLYLLAHSIRTYCWGTAIASGEDIDFDPTTLWVASLMHDVGLGRLARNRQCFEVEGAEIARRFVVRHGGSTTMAATVANAIVLHMRPGVTMDDGAEALLLDRATGLDVRGDGFRASDPVRADVMRDYPRGAFDRRFVRAIRRETERRSGCQSSRLLHETDLVAWMERSPWRAVAG